MMADYMDSDGSPFFLFFSSPNNAFPLANRGLNVTGLGGDAQFKQHQKLRHLTERYGLARFFSGH